MIEKIMSRIVCFIERGGVGTCVKEAQGKIIDCKKCSFYKKFKGKRGFSYCFWVKQNNIRTENKVSKII